ncbi:MAG: glycosyltransferase [Saprospiraceae bacterium]|nr:glycosyltransferase [Saprospiraceae bacterium]
MERPFLTIVTVCYNAAAVLEDTIKSVITQTCKDYEYIVIDGASKDDTLNIIEEYNEHINKWITEPDKGIYDAMNKGIELASGQFIWFLNAGDRAYDSRVVENLKAVASNHDVLYGEVMIVDDERRPMGIRSEITVHNLPERLTKMSMQRGMVVCHQGFIPSVNLVQLFMENNLSADIDWTIRILDKAKSPLKTSFIIAEYLAGGVSKKKWKKSLMDRFVILRDHFGLYRTLYNHVLIIGRAFIHRIRRADKDHY